MTLITDGRDALTSNPITFEGHDEDELRAQQDYERKLPLVQVRAKAINV